AYAGLALPGPSAAILHAKGDASPGWSEITSSLSVTGGAAIAGNVGIGADVPGGVPRGRLDLGMGGLNKNLRLGDYLDIGETDCSNFFYLGINAALTTSSIPGASNKFSPAYAPGAGTVMAQNGGGNGDIDFHGIDWKGSTAEKVFPTDFTH